MTVGALVALTSGCADPVAPSTVSTTIPPVVVPADPRAALAQAEARWASWRLQNYDFTVLNGCVLCGPPHRATFEVRNGVSRVVDIDPSLLWRFDGLQTVEQLFAGIRAAIDRPVFRLSATYHPTYGYPVVYAADYDEFLQDDVASASIESFVPR